MLNCPCNCGIIHFLYPALAAIFLLGIPFQCHTAEGWDVLRKVPRELKFETFNAISRIEMIHSWWIELGSDSYFFRWLLGLDISLRFVHSISKSSKRSFHWFYSLETLDHNQVLHVVCNRIRLCGRLSLKWLSWIYFPWSNRVRSW